MNRLARSLTRGYATRWPRPKPGTSERPLWRAPDPLVENPKALVTTLPDELTFIHRPPPTAPTPFSLTTNPASPLLRKPTAPNGAALPPPSRPGKEVLTPKSKHIPENLIEKIRRLRRSNPEMYTRGRLAKKYGVSQNFVGLIASLKSSTRKGLLKKREEEHAQERAKWSDRHQLIVAIRKKRREFW